MHSATASNNAFAKWETLGPPATTSSTSPSLAALSPSSSKVVAVAPLNVQRPKQQQARQPPATPSGSADTRPLMSNNSSEPFASGGGRGRSRVPSPPPPPQPPPPPEQRHATSGRAPGVTLESSAVAPSAAPGAPAPASSLSSQPEVPISSPAPLLSALVPPSNGCSTSGGSGGGGVGGADAESLLARLAGKAKQAAAAALSASAASSSSGAERTSPAAPPPLRAQTAAPPAVGSTPDVAGGPGDYVGSAATRPSDNGEATGRNDRRGAGSTAAAGAVEAGGCARLAELCKEDKAKVARLMQDLVKLRAEKDGQRARFERLRAQNEVIVKEMAALKVKFGQSMQLLRKYQSIMLEGEPKAGRRAGMGGSVGLDGAGSRSAEPLAAATVAADVKALREALRTAEEASRKAKAEAATAHAGRVAVAEELRRAKEQADDFRRRLDHHLRSEKPNPVAGRGRACQSIGSLNTVNTAPAWSREQAPAGPACCPMSSLSAAGGGHDAAAARGKSSVFQSSNTASKDDARPASSHGSQAVLAGDDSRSGDQAASGEEGATGRSPGLDQQQQQQQQQQQPSNGVAAVAGAGGGGGGHSVAQTERRRPEGREGGVASNAELAAVKEQVKTLKQQLVMVGVQQLALTGVPTGAALLNRHEGAFPFHGPAPPAADRSFVDDTTAAESVGAGVPAALPVQRDGDRSGAMRSQKQQQQQQQAPGRTTHPRRARRGRNRASGPQEVRARGCWESDSEGDGGGTPTEGGAGLREEILLQGSEPLPGGVASAAADDEEVGWRARSADKLLVLGDTIGHKQREPRRNESGQDGRTMTTTTAGDRGTRTGVPCKAHTDPPTYGRGGDRAAPSAPRGKAPLSAELPPAPVREPIGLEADHHRPGRGNAHQDVDADESAGGVVSTGAPPAAAGSGGGRLRVSWSSISARSSESDLEREPAPVSSVASARSNCSSSTSSRAGCRRRRRWGSDASGAASPRLRPPQQRQPQEQQQQFRSPYHRVSPSSCSSSSVSSHAVGRQNGGAATAGTGRERGGVSASRGAAAAGRRHHRDGSTEAPSGGAAARQIPKARIAAMPGPRRKLMHRAPIAGGNATTDAMEQAGKPAAVFKPGNSLTGPPVTKPTVLSKRVFGVSARSGRHRRASAGVDTSRESGGGGGGGGDVSGWETAAIARGARRTATSVALPRSSGEGSRWRGGAPSDTGRDRGLRGLPPDEHDDDDDNETLELEGGSFFDGSLLDLIDDLEQEESNETAQGSSGSRPSSNTGGGGMRDGDGWRRKRGEKVFSLASPVAALPPDNGEGLGDDSGGAFWRRDGDDF